MELVAAIGGTRLAAPPAGATDVVGLDLHKAAERYGELLALGNKLGVVPQVEVWGFSKTLGTLGEAAQVAINCGQPNACILADAYHLYKGGSAIEGLRLLSGSSMHVFHFNDYPATPPRHEINDAQPRFSRRRRRAAHGNPAQLARRRLPRRVVARAFQSRILESGCAAGRADGLGQDARRGQEGACLMRAMNGRAGT